jgi:hypothetical protein
MKLVTSCFVLCSLARTAFAQPEPTDKPPPTDDQPPKPKQGDFDAGGQLRLPNGPDETGKFATYNWVAVDLKGRYQLLDAISVNGTIPLAVKKPGPLMDGSDPKLIGGITARFEAKLPQMPKLPFTSYETELGLALTVGYMHRGAMLLGDKDYPLFVGDFEPGVSGGLLMKVKLSSVLLTRGTKT